MSDHDVVVVGGGAAGLATAASLLKRQGKLDVVVVDPSDHHDYQPGWTMVGGGVFKQKDTRRSMRDVIPRGVLWKQSKVVSFDPDNNEVSLETGENLKYKALVIAPGLKLDWDGVDGLDEALGQNGVTSNYRYDLAPYTWQVAQSLKSGRALFTQPPMPIKCAGAPQKVMYLSCDAWLKSGVLKDIDVSFHNAIGVLFGVATYVPALMQYIEKYDIDLCFSETLKSVDGTRKVASFACQRDGKTELIEREFDMLHVTPPQVAPEIIANSPLANESGWVDVDQHTLKHLRYDNIFGLGDACSTPNAKTAAAARKQAPIVAFNLLQYLEGKTDQAIYNGYGSCPLTVERGKIVLAEFGYDGKLLPTFPKSFLDGTKPTSRAWILKEKVLPVVYWNAMLKGREWLAKPTLK